MIGADGQMPTKSRPEVSVVMINFNGMPWLTAALESVLATEGVEIEVIVVDDCSGDDSRKFLSEQAALDSRVIPHFLEENLGISGARNAGLDLAKGTYISIVDSDDRFLPNTIKKQLDAFSRLREKSPDLALLTSDAWLINEAGERTGRYISREWWGRESSIDPPLWTLPSTFFFKSDRAARFHAGYRSADAPIFIERMLQIGAVGFTGEPLIEYRLRMASVTNRNGAHMLREMSAANESRRLELLDQPLSPEDVDLPDWRNVACWVHGRNAKIAAANGKYWLATVELAKATIARPQHTFRKLIRAFQTVGKRL
jgi:hypothetical protein